jgi:hypothetical protein
LVEKWGCSGFIILNLDSMDFKSILSLLEIANFEKRGLYKKYDELNYLIKINSSCGAIRYLAPSLVTTAVSSTDMVLVPPSGSFQA